MTTNRDDLGTANPTSHALHCIECVTAAISLTLLLDFIHSYTLAQVLTAIAIILGKLVNIHKSNIILSANFYTITCTNMKVAKFIYNNSIYTRRNLINSFSSPCAPNVMHNSSRFVYFFLFLCGFL